jgi:Siphovirus Gp157
MVIYAKFSTAKLGHRNTNPCTLLWMNTPALKNEVQLYQWLREKLLDRFPETDDETIRDTLEGITDLHEMIAEIIRSALIDEALQVGLRSRLDDMKQRLSRLEERGTKKRQLALDAMSEAGLRKLEQPDFTASIRAGSPHLVIVAEDVIPSPYWVPLPPKLDRQSLLAELKRGGEVPGTHLSNQVPTLSVRTK